MHSYWLLYACLVTIGTNVYAHWKMETIHLKVQKEKKIKKKQILSPKARNNDSSSEFNSAFKKLPYTVAIL